MTRWEGVLAATLVVRDEEDILAANLEYHLAQGVDVILVIDHGSTDGTTEILERYQETGRVRFFREEARPHDQPQRVNRLLRVAAKEYAADWVIHLDADEFWIPAIGTLGDVFAAIPEPHGYVVVQRNDFLPTQDDDEPFHQRMIVRHRRSLNLRGTQLGPKVAQRPGAATSVGHGNHELDDPVLTPAPDIGALEIFHFPLRTFDQFEHKVVNVGIGYECLSDRPPGVGCDQLELLAMHRRGGLREYYDSKVLKREHIENGLETEGLIVDRRLQAFLRGGELPHPCTAPHLLERMWLLASSAAEERYAAEAQLGEAFRERGEVIHYRDDEITRLKAELENARAGLDGASAELEHARAELDGASAELEHARRERAELHAALSTIRDSKVMRYTAPARRVYYRLRPTPDEAKDGQRELPPDAHGREPGDSSPPDGL